MTLDKVNKYFGQDAHGKEQLYGATVQGSFFAPMSEQFEKLEHLFSGVALDAHGVPQFNEPIANHERQSFEAHVKASPPREIKLRASQDSEAILIAGKSVAAQAAIGYAQVIPGDVLAAYRLCEYYWATEGDVRQTIETPMDICLRPLVIEHKDPGVANLFTQMYSPDYLNLDGVIPDLWLSQELYGSAYPMEIWDARIPSRIKLNAMCEGTLEPIVAHPQQVTPLNPKYMYVGRQPFSGSQYLMLTPNDDAMKEFRQQIIDLRVPPMTYNALSYDIHEQLIWAWNIPLDTSCVMQLRDKANNFVRYPWPSLMSCFRTISTRQVLEEMVRATIEGTKNQLWSFLLGDAEHPATADEIMALTNTVGGLAGLRTGSLVWRGNLKIDIKAPIVDALMANDKWQLLTEHLYRQRGISRKVVAGDGDQPIGPDDIDVKVLIQRLIFKRDQIANTWLKPFTRKVALLSGDKRLIKLAQTNNLPIVRLGDFGIDTEDQIKNAIAPMHQSGLLSRKTSLKRAGFDYDVELANKKSEEADKELFTAPATYSQTSTNSDGSQTKASSQRTQNKPHGEDRATTPRARRTGSGTVRGKAA